MLDEISLKMLKTEKIDYESFIGKKFGRLLVLDTVKFQKYYKFKCKCECGVKKEVYAQAVLTGATQSCGCFYKESRFYKKTKARSDIKTGLNSSAANSVWLAYKRNALSRGRSIELTKNQLLKLATKNCYYCGSPPGQSKRFKNKKSPEFKYNGVDRKNNDKGYTKTNSVPCCFICNRAKGQLPYSEFKRWIKNVIMYNKESL